MLQAKTADLSRLGHILEGNLNAEFRSRCHSIVDIGCGYASERDLLLEFFPQAKLTLIDQDEVCIRTLRADAGSDNPRLRIVCGDAAALPGISPEPVDFALIRHPDIAAAPVNWQAVLASTTASLSPDGILMIFTYTLAEVEALRRILRALPTREIRVRDIERSPIALAGNDRYSLMCARL